MRFKINKIWGMRQGGIWSTSLVCIRRTWFLCNQLRWISSSPLQSFAFFTSWCHPACYKPIFQKVSWSALLSLDSPKWGYITALENTTTATQSLWPKSRMTQDLTQKSTQGWGSWPLALLPLPWFPLLMCLQAHPNFSHLAYRDRTGAPYPRGKDSCIDTQSR